MKQTILDRFPMFERHVNRLDTIRKIRIANGVKIKKAINK